MLKIHIISETAFIVKGNGVHTAFLDHINLLKSSKGIDVAVNGKGKGDILHSHSYGPYFFLKGLKYRHRKILTAHVTPDSIKGSIPAWKFLMPYAKWYFKQVYSFADVCIAISPQVEKSILETGAKTRIERIYNPLPVENWATSDKKRKEGRKMLGISDNEFIILGVGQLESRKGVEDFIEISKHIPNAKFVWAGGRPFGIFTDGITQLNKSINSCKSSNITFTGMLDLEIMPLVYAAADLMLFTSYQENCPLAPIEAAACGLPVIFRDISEYKSLYKNTYLCAANNNEFISLTNKIIENADFYNKAKDISRNLITQFDKDFIYNQLMEVYQSLLKGKSNNHLNQD